MKKGKLIVIEGACDGVGKTTQFNMLINHLKDDGEDVYSHHFPSYGTYQGKPVQAYLNGDFGNPQDISAYFVNSLYAVDRGITWYKSLKNLYENKNTILLDRYTTSSLIYQAALIDNLSEREKFINYVCDFEYNKIGIKEPDLVIFLWAPFDLISKLRMERKQNEGIINDIHERDISFMRKVYDNAMFIANYLNWSKIDCHNGNMMRDVDDIHNEIYSLVKKLK